jgi:TonB family protein
MIVSNVITWSLQVGLVVAVAGLLNALLRVRLPQAKLIFWQSVLLACLALPFVRSWKHETIVFSVLKSAPIAVTSIVKPDTVAGIDPVQFIPWLLVLGALVRLVWILAGLWALRGYRRRSVPLIPTPSWGVEAQVQLSDDVTSPVTFGWLDPVILLPSNFPDLPEAQRDAILCHEVMHVRRHDWLFTVAEELLRTVLWFHPAIWWVLSEIQLAREEAVDREVIAMTRSRDAYVDALLAIAGGALQPDLATASAFLRKRHLKQRVVSIFKEIRMSQTRSFSTLAAGLILLAGSCWFITGAVPLYGAPQTAFDAPGVAVELNGAAVMHRNSVVYPAAAVAKRIEGTVALQVKLDGTGNVVDASVVSGPDELRKSALQSVLGWHFAKEAANSTRVVTISFQLPAQQTVLRQVPTSVPPPPGWAITVKSLTISGLSPQRREELLAALPVKEGGSMDTEEMSKFLVAMRSFDEHLNLRSTRLSPSEVALTILPEGTPLSPSPSPSTYTGTAQRIGANVMQQSLISQPKPVYPPLAKAARVQGTVTFEAVIDVDGRIMNLHLVSGPPLLVQAAMQAVQQWVYKPTLLNGNPVQVVTTIDVNFTLSQDVIQQ